MKNKLFKIFACFLTLTFVATPTSATLITDSNTVIVGDKEWAQVDLFYGLSWNEINGVCPNGICGSGILNSYDMTGWTWATASQVGDFLFEPFGVPPGSSSYDGSLADYLQFLSVTGFRTGIYLSSQGVAGWNSDFNSFFLDFQLDFGGESVVTVSDNGSKWENRMAFTPGDTNDGRGAWMYRAATVPEPSTLAILALGMLGLSARRFKK
jgi:hypothetical protein